MGCATSKQKKHVCRKCKESMAPMPRSYSTHSYHVVALTSSTLYSLHIDYDTADQKDHDDDIDNDKINDYNDEFSMGMKEAKSWSKMIDEKIPKVVPRTPIQTPPGEPETIDAMELMKGLEDNGASPLSQRHFRSVSFSFGGDSSALLLDHPTPRVQEYIRPLWENDHNSVSDSDFSDGTSIVSEFDPEIISQLRKSLEELPPANPFHLKGFVSEKEQALAGNEALELTDTASLNGCKEEFFVKQEKVVLYFTSLRGVRKTYEDCCNVRVILKGLNVRVDERDVSMHSGFKEELKELMMGEGLSGGGLPRVFVGKKYIGGAEEIRRMNEEGQLEKMLEGCKMVGNGGGGGGGGDVCEGCGDVRFVPCETCSGSCKIYYEADYEDEEQEEFEEGDCGFQRCPDCNENGLIRCPYCCD